MTECKALFPESQDTYVILGAVYERQGLYDAGIRELEPLVESGQAKPSVYSGLGCLLAYRNDLPGAIKALRAGHERYPADRSLIHNLAYVLLMNHEIAEGHQLLETYEEALEHYARENSEYGPVLMATHGLVYLLEGKTDVGIKLYKQAARSASQLGNRMLAGAVLQKMHIEMAKLFLNEGHYSLAKRETAAGLAVKRGREPFRRESKELHASLENLQ